MLNAGVIAVIHEDNGITIKSQGFHVLDQNNKKVPIPQASMVFTNDQMQEALSYYASLRGLKE